MYITDPKSVVFGGLPLCRQVVNNSKQNQKMATIKGNERCTYIPVDTAVLIFVKNIRISNRQLHGLSYHRRLACEYTVNNAV
jgi:hypothetical protein